MLIDIVKIYALVKFIDNGKHTVKVKFPNIVMLVHNSLTALV